MRRKDASSLVKKPNFDFFPAGQGGVGQHEASRPPSLELVGQQAEGVGVALKVGEVLPKSRGEAVIVPQSQSLSFGEEGGDGPFARMTERRITQVVRQAGGGHDGTYLRQEAVRQLRPAREDAPCHVVA